MVLEETAGGGGNNLAGDGGWSASLAYQYEPRLPAEALQADSLAAAMNPPLDFGWPARIEPEAAPVPSEPGPPPAEPIADARHADRGGRGRSRCHRPSAWRKTNRAYRRRRCRRSRRRMTSAGHAAGHAAAGCVLASVPRPASRTDSRAVTGMDETWHLAAFAAYRTGTGVIAGVGSKTSRDTPQRKTSLSMAHAGAARGTGTPHAVGKPPRPARDRRRPLCWRRAAPGGYGSMSAVWPT